ncbi:MAG: YncE family protein [Odoribacteraceae bacterium]|jgi:DNA-binding beta-propeller fold protein YncE|nr:YncE family protein [Odoribacteraceae bacterium]
MKQTTKKRSPRGSVPVLVTLFAIALAACHEEEAPGKPLPFVAGEGLFILNEGAWHANNATLDFWSTTTGEYAREIFKQVNPEAVLGLGELGNDIGIYGRKLYLVINGSDKVEVLDASTGMRLKTLSIEQPRYITFAGGHAYVSAYGGATTPGHGVVVEIDTATREITRRVEVGRQPEELVVAAGNLYVANSGGLSSGDYERTLSVISLDRFTRDQEIPVAINLHLVQPDGRGNLYVSSRGDYDTIPPRLFVVEIARARVIDSIDIPVSRLAIAGDTAYILGMRYSSETATTVHGYYKMDTRTRTPLAGSFITDGSEGEIMAPYGIAVHPLTGDIYVTDARTYDVGGKIFRFSPGGRKLDERPAGVVPAHVVFKR